MTTPDPSILRQKLNSETGRIAWPELERHFARGAVLLVSAELDLVEVAAAVAEDDAAAIGAWLGSGRVVRATDAHARHWVETGAPEFWAVVVAPWVLVQEVRRA